MFHLASRLGWGGIFALALTACEGGGDQAASAPLGPPRAYTLLAAADWLGGELGLATGANDKEAPALAYDSVNQRYLLVWAEYRGATSFDVLGQRLDATGAALGAPLVITQEVGLQHAPAVAFDPTNQQFLVVWHDGRTDAGYDLYGRLVSAAGALVGTSELPICTAAGDQRAPVVAYHAGRQRFVVAWADDRAGADANIYAQLLGPAGEKLLAEDLAVTTAAGEQHAPAIAYDEGEQRCLVAWHDERDGDADLYGQLVTGTGTLALAADAPLVRASGDQFAPALVYDPRRRWYVLTWSDTRGGAGHRLYAQALGPAADRLMGQDLRVSASESDQVEPALALDPAGAGYWFAWTDDRNGPCHPYAQLIDTSGALKLAGDLPLCLAAQEQQRPVVAGDPRAGKLLAAWQDRRSGTRSDLYGQLVTAAGGPDTAAPSWPTGAGFSADVIALDALRLKWPAALDDVGVLAYDLYENGTLKQSVAEPAAVVSGLSASVAYRYEVRARDAAGRQSTLGNPLGVRAPIDIRWGAASNTVKLSATGTLDVVLLGAAGLEATTATGVQLSGVAPTGAQAGDLNGDGRLDVRYTFALNQLAKPAAPGTTIEVLTGLVGGVPFAGLDVVNWTGN